MTRNHRDLQELLGAYALDAVDPDEAAELEEHLRSCPQCQAELAEHRSVASLLANTGGPAPAALWDRIAGSLDGEGAGDDGLAAALGADGPRATGGPTTTAAPATDPATTGPAATEPGATVTPLAGRRRGERGRRPGLVTTVVGAAAAAVVLVVGMVGLRTIQDQDQRIDDLAAQVATTSEDGAAAAALADPDATLVRLTAADGELAVPAVITEDGRGYLLGGGLPDAGDGETYQLWGLDGSRAVSLGVLGRDPRTVPFHVEGPVDTLALTTEVEGGTDQPTSDPVVAGAVDGGDDTTLPS